LRAKRLEIRRLLCWLLRCGGLLRSLGLHSLGNLLAWCGGGATSSQPIHIFRPADLFRYRRDTLQRCTLLTSQGCKSILKRRDTK
jgi:hypothetical protein